MTGDVVVLVTAIGVLAVALLGAALVSWWVWQGGRDR
jgi:Flp pilus assembly protein TadB